MFTDAEDRRGTAPRAADTPLQAAFLRHAQGGRWVGGGFILLKEDVAQWGSQVYHAPWSQRRADAGRL